MKILIGGDYAPKSFVSSMIDNGDYSFFDDIQKLSKTAHMTIINMESPFIESTDKPIEKWGPTLGCSPKTVDSLKYAGINAVTLANNHILDYGAPALMRTIEICHNNGIKTVGGGNNLSEASQPLICRIDGKSIGIINCCEHEFSIAYENHPGANPIEPIRQYYEIRELKKCVDYVLVIVHGGHEHFSLPSLRMQQTYRFFIDAGADVIVNHHQHCYSGYEVYKEKPIFYGLGNLCFEGGKWAKDSWYEGFMVMLDFNDNISFNIYPYQQFKNEKKISLLEADAFDKDLHILNNTIKNPDLLKKACDTYYEECSKQVPPIFEMYTNRIFAGLRHRNLLPSLFTNTLRRRISNFIMCEAHMDKIKYYFNKKRLLNYSSH